MSVNTFEDPALLALDGGVGSGAASMSTQPYSTTDRPRLVERATTLSIITIIGFIGNLILLVTICQSASLRSVYFNRHVISMAICNLLTCIFCLPMVIGYTVTSEWDYGTAMCQVVAHFVLTTSIATCLSILVLNIDRVVAISNPERYALRMTTCKTALMIIIVWVTAILFPLPLSLGIVSTTPFEYRYICSIQVGSDINYLLSLYSICFALPAVTSVLFFVYISREALNEREAESMGVSRRQSSAYRLWPEVQSAGVVFIIYMVWALCELPYITLTSIEQYIHSSQVNGQFQYLADLDTTFMWLKFSHSCLLPFIIFKWRKDVWLKFKDLMFCRKSNSVLDSSPRVKERNNNVKSRSKAVQPIGNAVTPKFQASFPIPTLTATKDGLHVQGNTDDDDEEGEDLEVFYADLNLTTKTEFEGIHSTTAIIEHEPPDGHTDETSDYETDPYSQSDPISVRSATSHQPVRLLEQKSSKSTATSHDSGNSSASSSVKKKRRKNRSVADLCIEDSPTIRKDQVEASQTGSAVEPTTESKQSEEMDSIECVEEPKPKPTKKKKKKKKQNLTDAETNTSQVINMEMVERKVPPPRLEPIKSELFQNSIATPPLRSRFPKESTSDDILPPSGASVSRRKKDRSAEPSNTTEEELPAVRAKKKKSKLRNKSGDSEKNLMSSSASSVVETTPADRSFLESHM